MQGGADGNPRISITSKPFPGEPPGIFPIMPPNILQQEILLQKAPLQHLQSFPTLAQAEILQEQPCSGKDECCLVVRAQGLWSGAVGSHSSFATESRRELR